jgi:hypothetical protein
MRPLATLLASGKQGISRFPCKVFSCMRKGFDRAGSVASRVGDAVGVAFRIVPLRRHPGPLRISRLNTWPARTPVNASTAALLLPPHDSGPVWSATPSPYGSLIHDTLPVCPALSGHSQHLKIKIGVAMVGNSVDRSDGGKDFQPSQPPPQSGSQTPRHIFSSLVLNEVAEGGQLFFDLLECQP